MASNDFSPPPGVPAEQIVVAPLSQMPVQQPSLNTGKIQIGNTDSAVVQDAEAGLITKTGDQIAFENKIAERKQRLEEARFKLEYKKAIHDMELELQRENFSEAQTQLDRQAVLDMPGEHWLQKFWRPTMGWLYMVINLFDFIIAPMFCMTVLPIITGKPYIPWVSLTLQNGGLIHMAFGAILGVTAYTRGINQKPINAPSTPSGLLGLK